MIKTIRRSVSRVSAYRGRRYSCIGTEKHPDLGCGRTFIHPGSCPFCAAPLS